MFTKKKGEKMNTIDLDTYDRTLFQEIKAETPTLQNLEEKGKKEVMGFSSIMEDVYGLLYKYKPEFLPDEKIEWASRPLKSILEQIPPMREYKDLRDYTRLQPFESSVAVNTFSDHLLKNIPQEIKDKMNELTITENFMNESIENISGLKDEQDINGKSLFSQTQKKISNLTGELQKLISKHDHLVRGVLRNAIQQGKETAQEAQLYLNSFGSEPGQHCKIPMGEKVTLLARINRNQKLKKIAQLAGRFQRMAIHFQETKTKHGHDEVVDIETGNKLSSVLPSEFALLGNGDLDLFFYRKYIRKTLLQFKMEGKEKESQGPIIICIDNSGSMTGDREIWSKVFALGLLTIAKKQKREFAIIHYGSPTEIEEYRFLKNIDQTNLLLALAAFFGGGTDFETPLKRAMAIIGTTLKKADIIFVTDGECSVSEAFNKVYEARKEQLGFRTFGILINTLTKTLPFKCDAVMELNSLNQDEHILKTIYGGI